MTAFPAHEAAQDSSLLTLARLLREHDRLFLLHEALAWLLPIQQWQFL